MTDSKSEQIVERIRTQIPDRVTIANGYHHDMPIVKRGLQGPDFGTLPTFDPPLTVFVVRGDDEPTSESVGSEVTTRELSLLLVGMLLEPEITNVETRLSRVSQDLEEYLVWEEDRQFGGLAYNLDLRGNSFDLVGEEDEGLFGVFVDLAVMYRHARGDQSA